MCLGFQKGNHVYPLVIAYLIMYNRFDHKYKHIDLPNKHKVVYD